MNYGDNDLTLYSKESIVTCEAYSAVDKNHETVRSINESSVTKTEGIPSSH